MPNENKNLVSRPPVVVILGHVDHGKSSILEAIKDLKITAKESGGITQHISAYEIAMPASSQDHQGKKITFIDTPGHEAFSLMRSRGAKAADIAVLVIAAEEGIKPQTKEAISHIKKVGIPMIVALNKIDKPQSDPEKVKRELMTCDVLTESMGGKIPCINISAKTKQGINELLEMILLVAEMENFHTDISSPAKGIIIEAHLDSKRGVTAVALVREGTLKPGDIIGTFSTIAKIKAMNDFSGAPIKEARTSQPVILIGFEQAPRIGEEFNSFSNIEEAKENAGKETKSIFQRTKPKEGIKSLNIIIKADVSGSLEAIARLLEKIPQEKAVIRVLKAEVGEINDSDVKLARTSEAMIIGFKVKANKIAQKLALRDKVRIINFEIIYELSDAVKTALEKRVSLETIRKDLGKFRILAVFKIEKDGRQIIGGKVTIGELRKGALLNVYRNEEKIGEGKIMKIQKEKKEIGEVSKGAECGILYKGDIPVQEDDILQAYVEEKYKPGLE